MKYDHNQICTADSVVEVGGIYDFKEESTILRVKVVAKDHNNDGIGFKLKKLDDGTEFNIWAKNGHYAYNGMWRLYDAGTYVHLPLKA